MRSELASFLGPRLRLSLPACVKRGKTQPSAWFDLLPIDDRWETRIWLLPMNWRLPMAELIAAQIPEKRPMTVADFALFDLGEQFKVFSRSLDPQTDGKKDP